MFTRLIQQRLVLVGTILWLFLALLLALISSCSEEPTATEEFLVKVNEYTLTEKAFNSQLKNELDVDRGFDTSGDIRAVFLDDLIRKQLLLQEARAMKLDQRENFRRTIERYWESTLIRDLLNEKGLALRKEAVVTPGEVKNYYDENKSFFEEQSLEEATGEIQKIIEDKRVAIQLEEWVDTMVKKAEVVITDETLKAKIAQKAY